MRLLTTWTGCYRANRRSRGLLAALGLVLGDDIARDAAPRRHSHAAAGRPLAQLGEAVAALAVRTGRCGPRRSGATPGGAAHRRRRLPRTTFVPVAVEHLGQGRLVLLVEIELAPFPVPADLDGDACHGPIDMVDQV